MSQAGKLWIEEVSKQLHSCAWCGKQTTEIKFCSREHEDFYNCDGGALNGKL